jgi:hypothetical protein
MAETVPCRFGSQRTTSTDQAFALESTVCDRLRPRQGSHRRDLTKELMQVPRPRSWYGPMTRWYLVHGHATAQRLSVIVRAVGARTCSHGALGVR